MPASFGLHPVREQIGPNSKLSDFHANKTIWVFALKIAVPRQFF